MKAVILFGITGDLARKRIIPALSAIQTSTAGIDAYIPVFAIARKEVPPVEFGTLKNAYYISGELDHDKTYLKLAKQIQVVFKEQYKNTGTKNKRLDVFIYSSLPPHMHSAVMAYFNTFVADKLGKKFKDNFSFTFLVEKPIGNDLKSAEAEFKKIESIIPIEKIKFIDHYLAKDTLIHLRKACLANPFLFRETLGSSDLQSIELLMLETIDVATRGAFYDKVGALFDVGQNHLLQMLAEIMKLRIAVTQTAHGIDSSKVKISKSDIIKNLVLDGLPIYGQYAGYNDIVGVDKNSKTETFFDVRAGLSIVFAKKIGVAGNIKFKLSSGKKLGTKKSGIVLTFKNKKEIFIDMEPAVKDAYQNIFESVLLNLVGDELFTNKEEILASWKFVSRAKKLKTNSDLIVYTSLRDIM